MKGEQSGVKSSLENTVKEMRQQIDPIGRKLFQPFEYMTSSQIRSLFSRMSALHKGGTLKPPSAGLELIDDINEDLDDITEQDLFYIGNVKKIEGEDILMKFLEKSEGNFRWPKRDQVEKVTIKFIFYGLVQLYGNYPFTMAYKCYKKNRLAIWK
ncbi:hypothetical protein AVEN_61050-1 [Araneus ventricosus]|uniref:Uncharacterized protein n=1 Tax=Araneus ventricosus TaxID=182803 RepID=A0A4Y2DXH8_ARAVE|nr:hypothetical protein AVEN_61050-1 [Araneus ventricosus]